MAVEDNDQPATGHARNDIPEHCELSDPMDSQSGKKSRMNEESEANEQSNAEEETDIQGTALKVENSLYIRGDGDNGNDRLTVPRFEYTPLDSQSDEARLLVMHPAENSAKHVRCDVETHPLSNLPPFVAIKNARGYRETSDVIEANGQALIISIALERFFRYLRTKIKEPTRIWVRYACVVEYDPEEQKKYWTREFSDKMYAKAVEVFDMHEINSRLVEKSYFPRVIAYTSWKKQWYTGPTEVVLPTVCPIRLGTKASIEEPTLKYEYMPLDMIADEIRIMCIMPSNDASARIVIHAAHCPIKCEVKFIALSYRWGRDETTEEVVLNGQTKLVQKNLADAIRAIRTSTQIVPMWIDAMSINQDDVVERGRQVSRMGTIYDNAISVFSYVGEPTDDAKQVLDFIRELSKHPFVRINDHGEFHLGKWRFTDDGVKYSENTIEPTKLARLCASLYKFLSRQYFQRAWVLQEVAFASNPTIIAGRGLTIDFDQLDRAAYNFQDMLLRDPSLPSKIQDADPSIGELNTDMLAYPRKLFYFRHMVSRGVGFGFQFVNIKTTSPGFLEVLVLARDFECTDPRDHIFGLWNLARDKKGLDFKADYNKPYEEVYAQFTQAWIAQHRTLDILGATEVTKESAHFYETAPSWCPNWSVPARVSGLVRKDHIPPTVMAVLNEDGELYSADGRMNRDSFEDGPLFFFESNVLHCTGIILDQINFIFDDAPDNPKAILFPDSDPQSVWRLHHWLGDIDGYYNKHQLTTYEDPMRAAWAMFHGDNTAAWPTPAESGYDPELWTKNERYVCLPDLSRHVRRYGNSYQRAPAWGVVKTVLRGRRPFFSENGLMGLAPAYITETDKDDKRPWLLAVVAGCSVPLLLRESEDGTYQLVGTCFVQGWMDGEWMEVMMGAESPREFWKMIKDDARILIF